MNRAQHEINIIYGMLFINQIFICNTYINFKYLKHLLLTSY